MSSASLQARVESFLRRAGVKHVDAGMVRASMVALAVLIGIGVWRWWPTSASGDSSFAASTPGEARQEAAARPGTQSAGAAGGGRRVLVHVVGAVRRPGVYELSAGDRVLDAVEAAGGMLPDAVAAAVNMAREVSDGEQVAIPDQDQVAAGTANAGGPGAGASPAAGGPVDLNSADAALLDTLPGIGPSTAAKIVADRQANGPFRSVDELSRVPGIGEKKLAQLEGLIRVR